MNNTTDDGGPAFARPVGSYVDMSVSGIRDTVASNASPGMSLRDYFAAAALQGIMSSEDFGFPADASRGLGSFPHKVAKWSYEFADAMIEAKRCREAMATTTTIGP